MVSLDVLTMGRISVDVYPLQVGVSLREVESFGKYLGGSSTNVAVAAARYGRRVRDDHAHGRRTRSASSSTTRCKGFGVDDRYVTAGRPACATPVAFCEIFPPDDFPLYFYREPEGAGHGDPRRTSSTTTRSAPRACSGSPSPGLSRRAEPRAPRSPRSRRAAKSGITVLDLDYRPMFWDSREEAREWVGRALEHVDRRGRQPRRDRHRGRRARAARRRAGAARPRRRARGRQAGPEGRARRRRRRARSRSRPCRSRSSTASARATRSAARSATAC